MVLNNLYQQSIYFTVSYMRFICQFVCVKCVGVSKKLILTSFFYFHSFFLCISNSRIIGTFSYSNPVLQHSYHVNYACTIGKVPRVNQTCLVVKITLKFSFMKRKKEKTISNIDKYLNRFSLILYFNNHFYL